MLRLFKKKSSDFFVSIGSGINQIPLIKEAKKAGFQVIGVDINPTAPGFYHCDLKIQESIEDYHNIYVKLRELLIDGKISSIMTKSYGHAIVTTSFLCEKFGIPFLPFEDSKVFLNKKAMRNAYLNLGIKIPDNIPITSKTKVDALKDSIFPIVSKPATGHAKNNVQLLNNKLELKNFIENKNAEDYVFERFVAGDEIICCGQIHSARFYPILLSDKIKTPAPFFVDIMHITPSKYKYLLDEITSIGNKIAREFKIQSAPMIMEFIVTEKDELYMMEAVPEFGGEFIPDIMVPHSTGYNHLLGAIQSSAFYEFKANMQKLENSPVVIKYITSENGILSSCSIEAIRKNESVIFYRIFTDIGARVYSPSNNHHRIGVIVTKGKSIEEAIAAAQNAEQQMNIKIKTEEENETKLGTTL
ncbi:MAG TPA: hypothetical protein P5566_05615 [Spirochaetota bacterium]|nr:hypothetical protein [Spirochaetota bacterium]